MKHILAGDLCPGMLVKFALDFELCVWSNPDLSAGEDTYKTFSTHNALIFIISIIKSQNAFSQYLPAYIMINHREYGWIFLSENMQFQQCVYT